MYLTCLEIDTSQTRGRTWLGNPYRVHQRLLMAFPDGAGLRLLFRIEDDRDQPRIIVQAPVEADWVRGFRDLPVLGSPPRQKEIALALRESQRLRFYVRANPTKRSRGPASESAKGPRPDGKRLGVLREADQRAWLEGKGQLGGFRPIAFDIRSRGLVKIPRGPGCPVQTHAVVDYEGVLDVTDPIVLASTVDAGIGAAKAFGFGMLSLAPP